MERLSPEELKLLSQQFEQLLAEKWEFLEEGWPSIIPANNHRTVSKEVGLMSHVKNVLNKRLGPIPVFFFLTVIWPKYQYPGPYKEAEKGLLLLYHIVKGLSIEAMEPHMPKSSFHAIHTKFYKKEYSAHDKFITNCLANMFSNITIRVLCAKGKNPDIFQSVTLHLDGHDTRVTYVDGESKTAMYSFKLKKPGLRTQVAMDINSMALWVSKSEPCSSFADGTMLLGMKIHKKMHSVDCMALDGGYTQYLKKLVEEDELSLCNFAHPCRKKRNQEQTEKEKTYNKTFGSFRSQMESLFAELGNTFEKHNNRAPVLVTKKQTYNLQIKLSLLLLNMKKMVALLDIPTDPIHTAWLRDGFEYPTSQNEIAQPMDYYEVGDLVEHGNAMAKLQQEFLGLRMDGDVTMEASQEKRCGIVIEIPIRKRKEIPTRKRKVPQAEAKETDDEDL
jgi:hypothetical protein